MRNKNTEIDHLTPLFRGQKTMDSAIREMCQAISEIGWNNRTKCTLRDDQ